jgi:hypothetical protein
MSAELTPDAWIVDDTGFPKKGCFSVGVAHQHSGTLGRIDNSHTLAIAQVFLGLPNDRQFLALARYRLSHPFPFLPKQPGYNKRLRRLVPQITSSINYLAFVSPSFCDAVRLLDSTPVPCGQSREIPRRSEFAGLAGYGHCRSHSRWLLGLPALPALRHRQHTSASSSPPRTRPSARWPRSCSSGSARRLCGIAVISLIAPLGPVDIEPARAAAARGPSILARPARGEFKARPVAPNPTGNVGLVAGAGRGIGAKVGDGWGSGRSSIRGARRLSRSSRRLQTCHARELPESGPAPGQERSG